MFGFKKRYCFKGQIYLKTALHIGGGDLAIGASINPVIKGPDGMPYIPGSSFKGAFRSTVEKLAASIGVWTCLSMEDDHCVGPQGDKQKEFDRMLRDLSQEDRRGQKVMQRLNGKLCYTCRLFGSPYIASKFYASDFYPPEGEVPVTQRRDGVAINRDNERAAEKLLYDYEVVPATQSFDCEIWLDNPEIVDLALVCLGLSEFTSGFAGLGGLRSRGLGNCELRNLEVYELVLDGVDEDERGKRLRKYLTGSTLADKMQKKSEPEKFIQDRIQELLANPNLGKPQIEGEPNHA